MSEREIWYQEESSIFCDPFLCLCFSYIKKIYVYTKTSRLNNNFLCSYTFLIFLLYLFVIFSHMLDFIFKHVWKLFIFEIYFVPHLNLFIANYWFFNVMLSATSILESVTFWSKLLNEIKIKNDFFYHSRLIFIKNEIFHFMSRHFR